MKSLPFRITLLLSLTAFLAISCSKEEEPEPFFKYPLPDLVDPEVAGRLTQRAETKNYIFYFAEGDTVQYGRCEAYVQWGMDYLGVELPKKIEFYKFRSLEEMEEALGSMAGGWAFPEEVSYATRWKWHNHECMHILSLIWSSYNYPPAFFVEGIAVAHEFDPYNDAWISRWNREGIEEPYIDIVKRLNSEGKLAQLSGIMESQAFFDFQKNQEERIAYPQAGVFTAYLIDTYGLEKFREVFTTLDWDDTIQVIQDRLEAIYEISMEELEQDWLRSLETPQVIAISDPVI